MMVEEVNDGGVRVEKERERDTEGEMKRDDGRRGTRWWRKRKRGSKQKVTACVVAT